MSRPARYETPGEAARAGERTQRLRAELLEIKLRAAMEHIRAMASFLEGYQGAAKEGARMHREFLRRHGQ